MKTLKSLIFCLIVILGVSSFAKAAPLSRATSTLHVTQGGKGDCFSWATACDLQTALSTAIPGDQVWVAAGIYIPTTPSGRFATFQLKIGVAIYGGFTADDETLADRDWKANLTTLSGDIGNSGDSTDNSYHVVTGNGVNGTAIMDGFTISGGNANGTYPHNCGGGMFNTSSSPTLTNVTFTGNLATFGGGMYNTNGSNPTLTNVTFSTNSATSGNGGGMYNESSSNPTLTNVTFSTNSASFSGGGMFNDGSSPTLTNVTFSANSAVYGGGMNNLNSSPKLTNVTFTGNPATNSGGGMYNTNGSNPTLINVTFSTNSATSGNGGGMVNTSSSPTLTNVTFTGNLATRGGGMYNSSSSPILNNVTFSTNPATNGGGMYNYSYSSPTLINVTFSTNSATQYGSGMYNYSYSSPKLTNVTFSANSATNGGGMYNYFYSSPTLTNVTFSTNPATEYGGGMYNDFYSSPTLINVTFSTNSATQYGGGMYNYSYSSPTLTNVTFTGNSAPNGGGMYNNFYSNPTLINAIVWGNTVDQINNSESSVAITYSDIQGGYTGTRNINDDPHLDPLANKGGFTQTHALPVGSPAIDTANPAFCPTYDQRYYARPIDGDGDGIAVCDMGAFEYGSTANGFTLTVATEGNGTVATNPTGPGFIYGEVVTLIATAKPGWTFTGWGGGATGTENPLTITIDRITTITATFTQNNYTLTVVVEPTGSGTVIVDPVKTTYHYGDVVTLTATANPGWTFTGWSGDAIGTDNKLTITKNTSITANFSQNEYTLTVLANPTEAGTVTRSPNQTIFHYGNEVTLTPNANPGWTFTGWSGGVTSTTNPLIVTITGDTSITANFIQNDYTLTVLANPPQAGTVTRNPDQTIFHYGEEVTLTPSANPGWTFASWSGNATVTDNKVTITGDTSITANWEQIFFRIYLPIVLR